MVEDKSPTRASSRVAAKGKKVYKEDPSDDEEGGGDEAMPAINDNDICTLAPPMKTDANNEAVEMASEDVAGGVAEEADANNNSLTAEI